jgi:hypothetical protein
MALGTAGGGVGEFCGGKFGLALLAEVSNTIPAAMMIAANIQRMVSVIFVRMIMVCSFFIDFGYRAKNPEC